MKFKMKFPKGKGMLRTKNQSSAEKIERFFVKNCAMSPDDTKKISEPFNVSVSLNEIMALVRLRSRAFIAVMCVGLLTFLGILYATAYNGNDPVLIALLIIIIAIELALAVMYRSHAKKETKKIAEEIAKNALGAWGKK